MPRPDARWSRSVTMTDLHAEFKASLKRQKERGVQHYLEIPKKPYKHTPIQREVVGKGKMVDKTCETCGKPVKGRGDGPGMCMPCRMERAKYHRKGNCGECGKEMVTLEPKGSTPYCRPCRKKHRIYDAPGGVKIRKEAA